MGTDSWKGHVNGILYGVQFDRVLDDTVVTRVADGVTAGLYPGAAPRRGRRWIRRCAFRAR